MQWAILTASALLLIGFVLRAKVRILQVLFVPASVIGGIVGLLFFQMIEHGPAWTGASPAGTVAPSVVTLVADHAGVISGALRGWPGPLIAVVFAGLLLERPSRRLAPALRGAALAGIMVWIIVLGEIAIGLAAGWLVIAPAFDVPPAFGQLLEAGFAGGHGTATALGAIFDEMLDFPEGLDLGLFMATIGLVYSILSGIVLVNIGVRRGWTRRGRADAAGANERELITGLEQRHDPVPAALARVRSEVIDPLAFQILIMAMAFLLGVLFQQTFILAARSLGTGDSLRYFQNVPLFLFTLLGGWGVRGLMTAFGVGDLIDGRSIQRMVAIAMEFLIVAAVASLRIEVVANYIGPLSLLCGLGFAWAVVCLLVISPRVLPREHWFELGLINYGMSTGTTAQGMMLLRIIDRDLESGAAEDYALAAPLSAPFIGGGLLTMSLPLILSLEWVPIGAVVGVLAAVVTALFFIGRGLNRRQP